MNDVSNLQIEVLTSEILLLKHQTAANIVEIGRRLLKVKEMLAHGEWGKWLKEQVEFTERTAQRFMKAAQIFGNATPVSHLDSSKVIVLLDVPEGEREQIVHGAPQIIPPTGEAKTIEEMTKRELEQVKKALKDAEQARAALEKANVKMAELEELAEREKAARQSLEREIEHLRQGGNPEARARITDLESQLKREKEAAVQREAEAAKLREAIAFMEKRVKELESLPPKVVEKVVEKRVESPELLHRLQEIEQKLLEKEKHLQELRAKQSTIKEFQKKKARLESEVADLLETRRKLEEANDEQERIKKRALEFHAALRRVMRPLQEEWGNLEFLLKQCHISAVDAAEVNAYVKQLRDMADTLEFHLNMVEGEFVSLDGEGVPVMTRYAPEVMTVDV